MKPRKWKFLKRQEFAEVLLHESRYVPMTITISRLISSPHHFCKQDGAHHCFFNRVSQPCSAINAKTRCGRSCSAVCSNPILFLIVRDARKELVHATFNSLQRPYYGFDLRCASSSSISLKCALRESGCRMGYENVEVSALSPALHTRFRALQKPETGL